MGFFLKKGRSRLRRMVEEEVDRRMEDLKKDFSRKAATFFADEKRKKVGRFVLDAYKEYEEETEREITERVSEKMDALAPLVLKDHLPDKNRLISEAEKEFIRRTVRKEIKAYMKESMGMDLDGGNIEELG